MSIQLAILLIAYIFTVVPILGRLAVIGASTKSYWVGYHYEECLERGFKIHIWLLILTIFFWAVFTV